LSAVIAFAAAGCRQEDEIARYDVEHVDRETLALRVAVFEHGDWVWFFRISGPKPIVEARMPEFESLVKSVRFDDKKSPPISFTDPPGWKKDPKMKLRFASYLLEDGKKPIEVKISKLERKTSNWLANIHRWQKELNVPLAEEQEVDALKLRDKVGDREVIWVKLDGRGIYQLGSRDAETRDKSTPFKFEVPEGWDQQPANDGITALLFVVSRGNQHAKVTFTSAAGTLADNINRWRGKIGLDRVDDARAVRDAGKIKVIGVDADYVDLDNPQSQAALSRILAVLVPVQGRTWVIYMSGPRDFVGQNKDSFETFVKSLQLDVR
jgi:hypothetical protein